MRVAIFVALFCLVAFTAAETLKTSKLRGYNSFDSEELSESAFLAMKESPFGKNLFSMLSLKYKTSGRLDKIIDLLNKLAGDIKEQQSKEDAAFGANLAHYNGIIAARQKQIKADEKVIKDSEDELKIRRKELAATKKELADREAERDAKQHKLDTYPGIRKAEHSRYLENKANQEVMIAGIDAVVKVFRTELVGNKELDAKAVAEVLDQLEDLRRTLVNSIAQEKAADEASERDFQQTMKELHARVNLLNKSIIPSLKAKIAQLEARIRQLEELIRRMHADIKVCEEIIADTRKAIADMTARHNSNTKVRNEQLALISQVKTRLTTNPKSVQHYINGA